MSNQSSSGESARFDQGNSGAGSGPDLVEGSLRLRLEQCCSGSSLEQETGAVSTLVLFKL